MTINEVPSLRAVVDRVAIQLSTHQRLTGLLRHNVPRNDTGGPAGFLFDWSLKSHVQPLWMALSAFTMAEILLSLTIIGVVAAITLPSLTGNINERTWNTQRKALYSRMSQAIALMPALNGYGTLREKTDSAGSTSMEDTAAETFVTSGLAKVLKINNICDSEHLEDCGLPKKVISLGNSLAFTDGFPETLIQYNSLFNFIIDDDSANWHVSYSQLDTKAAAFETQNGESIVVYYNPNCRDDDLTTSSRMAQPFMCANFIYDLNGSKGPNTVGKDIGWITVLYASDSKVVAPYIEPNSKYWTNTSSFNHRDALSACGQIDKDYRLPNREELASLIYNKVLFDTLRGDYWSSSQYSSTQAWDLTYHAGEILLRDRELSLKVICIKR